MDPPAGGPAGGHGGGLGPGAGRFLPGLSLGAAAGGWLAGRVRRPWRWAAGAEAAVALPALLLPHWTGWVWPALGPEALVGAAGGAVKFLLSALVVTPPAAAMGAVLPLALAGLPPRPDAARTAVRLYAANTAGGVAGLGLLTFVLLDRVGVAGALLTAAAANLTAAAGFAALDRIGGRREPPVDAAESEVPGPSPRRRTGAGLLVLAAASGFAVLAAEVLALRAVMLVAPLSFHAPAVVLGTVLTALALGAAAAPRVAGRPGPTGTAVPAVVGICTAPLLFMWVARQVEIGPEPTFAGFLTKLTLFAAASLGPCFFAAGLLFPAVAAEAKAAGGAATGRRWGRLLAVNGVAGWLGAEVAYRVLMPSAGLYPAFAAVGAALALAAAAAALLRGGRDGASAAFGAAGAACFALWCGTGPLGRLPTVSPRLGFEVLAERIDREGAVAVVAHPSFGRAILVSNQYLLGSTSAAADQRRQAHLPLLLHPRPERVAFIGVATGITPGAAPDHSAVRRVTAVELSPAVVEAARDYFTAENGGLVGHPRAEVVVEDGRTFLAASPGRFDAIVGDLILPWSPGEGRLYSREHFAAATRALRPGGLYAQWLPLYQLTPGQFRTIRDTFLSVFPRAELVRRGFGVRSPAVALVGWRDGAGTDWAAVRRRCAAARADGLRDPAVRHAEAVAMLHLGPASRFGDGPPVPSDTPAAPNTLDRPRVELDAGRERVTGVPNRKYLRGGRWLDLLERGVRGRGGATVGGGGAMEQFRSRGLRWSEAEARLLIADRSGGGDIPTRSPPLPDALRTDDAADWSLWPADPRLAAGAISEK